MRDVVVIGGGLSGLAACHALEKSGAAYTVIEVKGRFGGAIRSSVEGGFIMDAGAFAFRRPKDESLLAELRLEERVFPLSADVFAFRDGAESLVRALAGELGGGQLLRMAVSSIGRLRNRFTICLENGIMLDAGALILAVPAPFAARMLWNLAPAAAEQLTRFEYDAIRRVSLGLPKRNLPSQIEDRLNETFPFIITTDEPPRAPDRDHALVQVGVRRAARQMPQALIRAVTRRFGFSEPLVARVDFWAEAGLLSAFDASHLHRVRAIRDRLPAGLSLIGSDYCREAPEIDGVARLEERLRAGKQAARQAIAFANASARR